MMSLSWRDLVKRKRKQLQEEMKLSDEEMNSVFENMGEYCRESDGQIRLVYGENCNVDKVVDCMSEREAMQMTKEVIREVMEKLRAKKKKKAKTDSKNEESEEDQEKDANDFDEEQMEEQEVETK